MRSGWEEAMRTITNSTREARKRIATPSDRSRASCSRDVKREKRRTSESGLPQRGPLDRSARVGLDPEFNQRLAAILFPKESDKSEFCPVRGAEL